MGRKVLVATVKPFAPEAVEQIRSICSDRGYDLEVMEKYADQQDLVNGVAGFEALIVRSDKVTSEVIGNGRDLKIVVRAGAGYDNVDLDAATDKGIVVMNTPGQNSNAVAELAFGMMVYMARGQFNGKPGTELKGKKLGIHAYGNVGRNVARIAAGFDMEVYAYDPYVPSGNMEKAGVKVLESVQELYKICDYISLHLPSIAETRNFVNYELLTSMKKGATLINTARKEVVDEQGLLKALTERDDIKYSSDIAPEIRDELLRSFPDRCYFTPKKMGAQTKEANINAGVAAVKQIIGFFEDNDTTFQVNK